MLAVFSVSLWIPSFFFQGKNHSYILIIIFAGEDALANLSIERTEAGTITGHVRIRSKTQGIALSLGDRITMGMSSLFQTRSSQLFKLTILFVWLQPKEMISLCLFNPLFRCRIFFYHGDKNHFGSFILFYFVRTSLP